MSDLTNLLRMRAHHARWSEMPELLEAADLIDAIDHVHVVTTSTNWGVATEHCLFDGEVWPCWHHRQLHPDDPVVQDYVEKVRQQMDEIS